MPASNESVFNQQCFGKNLEAKLGSQSTSTGAQQNDTSKPSGSIYLSGLPKT